MVLLGDHNQQGPAWERPVPLVTNLNLKYFNILHNLTSIFFSTFSTTQLFQITLPCQYILVELTNTTFVNSTNISSNTVFVNSSNIYTNIETTALSKLFVYFLILNINMGAASTHGNKVQLAIIYNLWLVWFLSIRITGFVLVSATSQRKYPLERGS